MNRLFALAALSKSFSTFGMVVRPSPYRWLFLLPVIAINGYCYFSTFSEDSIRVNILIETLMASDYILLTDIQREFRQIGQQEPIYNLGIWARFKWTVQLLFSPRGVGWTHEMKSIIPSHPNLTRLEFLRSRFISLIMALIGNDIAFILTSIDPGFSEHAPPFDEQPVVWRFWATGLFFFRLKSAINVYLLLVALLLVGTGLSEPDVWPDFFGKLSDAYTVRRWWGRVWHQQLRRIFSSHGKFLSQRVCGFRTGTLASSYTRLYLAFFLSGLIHITSLDPRPIRFFLSQAVVITFEDSVIAAANRVGFKRSQAIIRVLGYFWVYFVLSFTFGPWLDSMNATGVGGYDGTLVLGRYRDSWWLKGLLTQLDRR
ncbi:hypothetical protein K435DRAFT_733899 [Dendrothele bispora CBS 962.96]|uniref:Wax synthase domain-containing protein n=1 Tax=Dendrothele bispora (strain CBS 962.96) TaxID=1314807 RepID=A0A4V4HCI6_DENBC|nr:hypothetical protein K435DRAFT_733899 [Dendrothele bispora CBS 962.96]